MKQNTIKGSSENFNDFRLSLESIIHAIKSDYVINPSKMHAFIVSYNNLSVDQQSALTDQAKEIVQKIQKSIANEQESYSDLQKLVYGLMLEHNIQQDDVFKNIYEAYYKQKKDSPFYVLALFNKIAQMAKDFDKKTYTNLSAYIYFTYAMDALSIDSKLYLDYLIVGEYINTLLDKKLISNDDIPTAAEASAPEYTPSTPTNNKEEKASSLNTEAPALTEAQKCGYVNYLITTAIHNVLGAPRLELQQPAVLNTLMHEVAPVILVAAVIVPASGSLFSSVAIAATFVISVEAVIAVYNPKLPAIEQKVADRAL